MNKYLKEINSNGFDTKILGILISKAWGNYNFLSTWNILFFLRIVLTIYTYYYRL